MLNILNLKEKIKFVYKWGYMHLYCLSIWRSYFMIHFKKITFIYRIPRNLIEIIINALRKCAFKKISGLCFYIIRMKTARPFFILEIFDKNKKISTLVLTVLNKVI